MRLSIRVQVDAVTPAAIERRAVPFAIAAFREHRAPAFPLAPFLAHLAATWSPSRRVPGAEDYRISAVPPRALTDRSV